MPTSGSGSASSIVSPSVYADWAVQSDCQLLLDSCGVTTRLTTDQFTDRFNRARSDVIALIARKTHRQFLAATATRFYDGTGAAEQEVDEMVSLSSVVIIGLQSDPGYTLDNVVLVSEQAIPQTRLIVAQGSLPAYASSAAFLPYRTIFPVGRLNIKVTGVFGFAATVPEDLWNAACAEMAFRLTQEVLFRPIGRVAELSSGGGISTHYKLDSAAITGWHTQFAQAMIDYRRPSGRRLRMLHSRMI